MTIFLSSFRKYMKWKFTIVYIIIMSILSIILSFVLKHEIYGKDLSLVSQTDYTIAIYLISVFMWVLGIPF